MKDMLKIIVSHVVRFVIKLKEFYQKKNLNYGLKTFTKLFISSQLLNCISFGQDLNTFCTTECYYKNIVKHAAKVNGIPEKLLLAVCKVESNYNPLAINWSKQGNPSVGLCQIEPNTAKATGFPCDFKGNYKELFKPTTNAICAAKHMSKLLAKYKNEDHALAAYNLGHLKFNSKGEIWNRGYVAKVRKVMNDLR